MSAVTVLDYGIGNLLNVVRALTHVGAHCTVVSSAAGLPVLPERVVLPGVGAFGDGMHEMDRRGLADLVRRFADTGRPFLGVCVGMQMLFDASDEFGDHAGLGLLPGRVKAIAPVGAEGVPLRLPHIAWSPLSRPASRDSWAGTVLCDLSPGEPMYFVHSFAPVPEHPSDRLAQTDYDGVPICAAVQRGALTGCQFHPERSGPAGLVLLKRFLAL